MRNIIIVTILPALPAYFLATEHGAHLALAILYLPLLVLVACPLMHLFMHRGHANHGGGDRHVDHGKST